MTLQCFPSRYFGSNFRFIFYTKSYVEECGEFVAGNDPIDWFFEHNITFQVRQNSNKLRYVLNLFSIKVPI